MLSTRVETTIEIGGVHTSARIMFSQEFLERFPASTNSYHHSATQDAHQTQLLGVTKLKKKERKKGEKVSYIK